MFFHTHSLKMLRTPKDKRFRIPPALKEFKIPATLAGSRLSAMDSLAFLRDTTSDPDSKHYSAGSMKSTLSMYLMYELGSESFVCAGCGPQPDTPSGARLLFRLECGHGLCNNCGTHLSSRSMACPQGRKCVGASVCDNTESLRFLTLSAMLLKTHGMPTCCTDICNRTGCLKKGTLCCGRCGLRYCGQECQAAAWHAHKSACRAASAAADEALAIFEARMADPCLERLLDEKEAIHGGSRKGNCRQTTLKA